MSQNNRIQTVLYIELPKNIKWSNDKKTALVKHILSHCKDKKEEKKSFRDEDEYDYDEDENEERRYYKEEKFEQKINYKACYKPKAFHFTEKKDLYGSIKKEYFFISFGTKRETRNFADWMIKRQKIYGFYGSRIAANFSPKTFLVHEHNIDPLIHLAHDRQIKLASWMSAKNCVLVKNTKSVMYYECEYKNISKLENERIIQPRYLSFDFECNSKNHNAKLPDPEEPENVIFHWPLGRGHAQCRSLRRDHRSARRAGE